MAVAGRPMPWYIFSSIASLSIAIASALRTRGSFSGGRRVLKAR